MSEKEIRDSSGKIIGTIGEKSYSSYDPTADKIFNVSATLGAIIGGLLGALIGFEKGGIGGFIVGVVAGAFGGGVLCSIIVFLFLSLVPWLIGIGVVYVIYLLWGVGK